MSHGDDIRFEIIEGGIVSKDRAEAIENEYRPSRGIGWNIAEGGGLPPSNRGKKRPLLSERFSGEGNPFYGKRHTESTRVKLSESKTGENHPYYGKARPEHSKLMASKRGIDYPSFRGRFVTPCGVFESYKEAHEKTGICIASLYAYCESKNNKVVSKLAYRKSMYLQSLGKEGCVVGKTYADLGFGFEYE